MARKHRDEGGDSGTWLNTYADMITLVLTFFVALFSMSTLNAEAVDAIAKGQNPGGSTPTVGTKANEEDGQGGGASADTKLEVDLENLEKIEDISDLREYIEAYIEANNLQDQVRVSEGQGSVYIRFNSDVFFSPDKYNLQTEIDENGNRVVPILDFLGRCFNQIQDQLMMVNVYGHTAEVKTAGYPVSALMLSSERAASVAIYLQDNCEIDPKILTPIGQGNTFPIASNDTVEGRAKNRRVDIAVVSNKATITDTEEVLRLLQGTFDEDTYPRTGGVGDVIFPQEPGAASGESAVSEPESSGPAETASQEAVSTPAESAPTPDAENSNS